LYGHPAATRASFVQTANDLAIATSPTNRNKRFSLPRSRSTHDTHGLDNVDDVAESSVEIRNPDATDRTPLLRHASEQTTEHATIIDEAWMPTSGKAHVHGGSMNMKALLLHVLGDALGNVGVIATGLIIWFTSWSFKYYCDPLISLVITAIIFHSALPLGELDVLYRAHPLIWHFSAQHLFHLASGCSIRCIA